MIKTATIAAAGTKSTAATTGVGADIFVALTTDAAWTTSNVSFEASYTEGGTFLPIKIEAGTVYLLTGVAASGHYPLNSAMFLGAKYIKVVAVTTQTDATTVTLISKIL